MAAEVPASPPLPGPPTIEPLRRDFLATAPEAGPPRAVAPAPPRDLWLRLSLFCTLLGAALTAVYAWVQTSPQSSAALAAGLGSYQRLLVTALALASVAGALLLERAPAAGTALMLLGTGLGLGSGTAWLVPGLVLACVWAARHSRGARMLLGFVLLLPGIAAAYFGLLGTLSFLGQVRVGGVAGGLPQPLSLAEALTPLALIPVAVAGAWLLVTPPSRSGPGH